MWSTTRNSAMDLFRDAAQEEHVKGVKKKLESGHVERVDREGGWTWEKVETVRAI